MPVAGEIFIPVASCEEYRSSELITNVEVYLIRTFKDGANHLVLSVPESIVYQRLSII
jgi:hypothetical protein